MRLLPSLRAAPAVRLDLPLLPLGADDGVELGEVTMQQGLVGGIKGETPQAGVPMGLIRFSQRQRAYRALIEWVRDMDRGNPADVTAYAEKHRLSKRSLLKMIREDETLRNEVFAPIMVEAKIGVRLGVAAGLRALVAQDETFGSGADASTAKRLWAEFFARLDGGGFEARKAAPPVLILQQLIPDLPPQARAIQTVVLEGPQPATLEEALGQ